MFGAGCWAERMSDGRSIACSVSGQGELIMQSSMAKTLAERIAAAEGDTHDVLRSVLVDHFYSALSPSIFVCEIRRDTSCCPARQIRQVASTGGVSASGGRASPYTGRGWGREHQSVITSRLPPGSFSSQVLHLSSTLVCVHHAEYGRCLLVVSTP